MSTVRLTKPGQTEAATHHRTLRTRLQALRDIPAVTVFEWAVAITIVASAAVGFTIGMAAMLSGDVSTPPQQSCANWFGSTAADSSCIP